MEQQVRVELIPRMVAVDADVYADHERAVERLGNLGHIDPSAGTIPETMQAGWLARINGVEVPVVTYGVEPAEKGTQALVSLLVPAESVSIGEPSTAVQQPQAHPASPPKNERKSMWGTHGPDPRENIPGWKPPTDGPVTVHFDNSLPVDLPGHATRTFLGRRSDGGTAGVLA